MLARARPGSPGGLDTPTVQLIHKVIVSSSVATVDIANTDLDWTHYNSLIFKVRRLTVVTDDVEIYLRVYNTTLAAWQSGGTDYGYSAIFHTITAQSSNLAGAAQISLTGVVPATRGVGNAANEFFSCTIEIDDPGNTTALKTIEWYSLWGDTTGNIARCLGAGWYGLNLNAISGFRFLAESGNIDGADILVYGVK